MKRPSVLSFLLCFIVIAGLPFISFAQVSDKAKLQEFENAITRGEEYFQLKDYAKAKAEYQKASSIDPSAKYPKDKLAQIRKVYIDPQDELKFKEAIEQGDKFFENNNFKAAKEQYNQALYIKPDDRLAREKLNTAEKQSIEKDVKLKEYTVQVEKADNLFIAEEYIDARALYAQAQLLNPAENYPSTKINQIDSILAAKKSNDDRYDNVIREADEAYMNKLFDQAITKYQEASKLKPQENYPKSMVERVTESLSTKDLNQQKYFILIKEADGLFNSGDYEGAITTYQEAQKGMPNEKYPSDQIAQIKLTTKLLADKNKNDSTYNAIIYKADELFSSKDYESAITTYQRALKLKPDEKYPADQIAKINVTTKLLADKNKNDSTYNEAIASGDNLIIKGEYDLAIEQYQLALSINETELLPREGIKKANELKEKREQQENYYLDIVSRADNLFKVDSLDEALTEYKKASIIKPDDKHVVDQIMVINKIQLDLGNILDKYNKLVKEADKYASNDEFERAISIYRESLALKPGEKYPQERIETLTAKIKDKNLVEENLKQQAIEAQALKDKKDEQLKALVEHEANQAKEEEYSRLINEADSYFNNKEYSLAKITYNEAAALKPSNKYPSEQLAEITRVLDNEAYEANKIYQQAIEKANLFYMEQDYQSAIIQYEIASEAKPLEALPKDKLIEIRNYLGERMKNNLASYNKFLSAGDVFYQSQVFDKALDEFEKANEIRPQESYPSMMIERIKKHMDDNAIVNLVSQPVTLLAGHEKKFSFKSIEMRARKNNYILITAKKTTEKAPKVFINYGIDGQKNGGMVMKGIESEDSKEYLLRISVQDMWYRADNNWISLYAEGGDIEISSLQISQGDLPPVQ